MKIAGRATALCAAAAALTVLPTGASAGEDFVWGRHDGPTTQNTANGGCTVTATAWPWEQEDSGVTRLAAEWQRRGPYDRGHFPAYDEVGWWFSAEFPDDGVSYFHLFTLPPGYLNFPAGKEYALWVKFVGERPSFWRPDLVLKGKMGSMACTVAVDLGT